MRLLCADAGAELARAGREMVAGLGMYESIVRGFSTQSRHTLLR